MNKIISFLKKPRNVYFSIIVMLTCVTGLFSISFSYYVPKTSNSGVIKYQTIDNRIQSSDLIDGYITLNSKETRFIKVYVMSNNDFKSKFKLYYNSLDDVKVYSEVELDSEIDKNEVYAYDLSVSNFSDKEAKVYIGISSALIDNDINIDGKEIELFE